MKWLIQREGFANKSYHREIETFERLGLEYDIFDYIPFSKDIPYFNNLPDDRYVIRGGVEITRFNHPVIKKSLFYDVKTFDQNYYGQLGLPLLNADATSYIFSEIKNRVFTSPVFVKPSRDNKAFSAVLLSPGETLDELLSQQIHNVISDDETVLCAPTKKIFAEYRFFVINQQIITGSRYHLLGKLSPHYEIPSFVMNDARQYAKLYQPHDVFTMDIAMTDEGAKIVEYNCWNASGIYDTDIATMFLAVEDYVNG